MKQGAQELQRKRWNVMSEKEDLIYIYLISIMSGVFLGQELVCSGGSVGWIEYLGSILQRRETLALESIFFALWARILLFSFLHTSLSLVDTQDCRSHLGFKGLGVWGMC